MPQDPQLKYLNDGNLHNTSVQNSSGRKSVAGLNLTWKSSDGGSESEEISILQKPAQNLNFSYGAAVDPAELQLPFTIQSGQIRVADSAAAISDGIMTK